MTAREGRRIACVDFGGTEVKIEVLEYWYQDGKVMAKLVARLTFATSQPNDAEVDKALLFRRLRSLQRTCGFEGVIVGIAAQVGMDGMIAKGGSLNWAGYKLGEMLEAALDVPCLIANDGPMYAAYELVFGVLADSRFCGRNFFVAFPGTGIGTCTVLWAGTTWMFVPSESQHNPYDRAGKPNGCNCGNACYESFASGSGLRRQGIIPEDLDEEDDVALMAPVLGALFAAAVRMIPCIDLGVLSGRVVHRRPSMAPAVNEAAQADLANYAKLDVVQGSDAAGGTRGCLAYYLLANGYVCQN